MRSYNFRANRRYIYQQQESEGRPICGIYGYIGSPEAKHEKFLRSLFETLGKETEERGIHAPGFYAVSGDEVYTSKAPVKASDFYKSDAVWADTPLPSILIGHNRWASHGDPSNNANNHPFTTRRFGFIHNGIVGNVDTSSENLPVQSECDSEIMFRYFVREFHLYGGESHPAPRKAFNVIEKTMKRFDEGDFACALVDSKLHRLYLFRNAGRPCWITALPFCNVILFASTREILSRSLVRHGISVPAKAIRFVGRGVITRIDEACKLTEHGVTLREPRKAVDVYAQYLSKHAITNPADAIPKAASTVSPGSISLYNDIQAPLEKAYENQLFKKPSSDGDWKCQKCGKAFPTAYLCKEHLVKSHGTGQAAARLYIEHVRYKQLTVDFSKKEFGEVVIDGRYIPASEVV